MKASVQERLKSCAPALALLLLVAIGAATDENFRSLPNFLNLTRQVAGPGLVALGMTLVIISGGIDLSVGSLLALSGVAGMLVLQQLADPVAGTFAALGVMLAVGLIGGKLNGALVTYGKIPAFIATLGTMSIFRSLALHFADAGTVSSENALFGSLGRIAVGGIPLSGIVFFGAAFLFWILLERTRFGRHLYAVGSNQDAAAYAAIPVGRVRFAAYALAGLAAGLAAFLSAARLNSASSTDAGLAYELDAVAAAVIGGASLAGGKGSIWGTVAGIFILVIISNLLDLWGAPANLQGAVKGAIIILAVLVQRPDEN